MATEPGEIEDLRAASLGEFLAVRDVLMVLIRTHPDIDKIAVMMRDEREDSIALMLANGLPDKAIDVYRDTIDMIRPHREGDDISPP